MSRFYFVPVLSAIFNISYCDCVMIKLEFYHLEVLG